MSLLFTVRHCGLQVLRTMIRRVGNASPATSRKRPHGSVLESAGSFGKFLRWLYRTETDPMSILPLPTLITGASSGIGHATALLLARQGCPLLLTGRNDQALASVARECRDLGSPEVRTVSADLCSEEGFQRFTEAVCARPLGVAILNAGMGQSGPFATTAVDDWKPVLQLNLTTTLHAAQVILRQHADSGLRSLVFISSVLGKRAVPFNAVYCASKHALHGFATALRLELEPQDIHVGLVCPARTDTAFFDRVRGDRTLALASSVPTASPERVARDILRCLRGRRREVISTAGGILFSAVGSHFPRTMDVMMRLYYAKKGRR